MSGESLPTLSGAIPAFEMFLTTWEVLAEKNAKLKTWIDIGLKWATDYYKRMDCTSAYIIAMGMCIILFYSYFPMSSLRQSSIRPYA